MKNEKLSLARDIEKFSKMKYYYVHRRFRTPLLTYLFWEGLGKHHNKKIKYEYEMPNFIDLDNELACDLSVWDAAKARIKDYLKADPDLLLDIIKISYDIEDEMLKQIEELNKSFSIDKLEEFFNNNYRFSACMLFSLLTENDLEESIRKIVGQKFKSETKDVFHILTTPQRLSSVKEKDIDIHEIACLKDDNEREKRVKKHLEKYAWLKNGSHNGDFFTKEEILKEIAEIKNPKEDLKRVNDEIAKQAEDFKNYFSKLNKDEQRLVKTLGESIHFRSWRTERGYYNGFKLDKVYRDIAKVIGLSDYRDVFYLIAPEIINLLKSKGKADKSIIEERKKGYIMVTDELSTRIYSGEAVRMFKEKVNVLDSGEKNENKEDLAEEYLKLIGKRRLWTPLTNYSIFIQGSEYNTEKYLKRWYNGEAKFDLFIHIKEGFSQVWMPEEDFIKAANTGFSEFLNDPKSFQKRIDHLLSNAKKIDRIYREYSYSKIAKTSISELLPLVEKILYLIWDANGGSLVSIVTDKKMCLDFIKEEKYPLRSEELDSIWEKAVEPAFESFDKSQLLEVLDMIKDKKPWKEVIERSQYVITDFHSAKTLKEVEKTLRERYGALLDNSESAIEAIKEEVLRMKEITESHNKWLESLSKNEQKIADYLQKIMKFRDRRKNFFLKGLTIVWRIAEKMFDKAGIEKDLIPYYSVRELLKGLDYLKSVKANLEDRKKGYQWLVPYEGEPRGLNINIDQGFEKINNYFKEGHLANQSQDRIKGQAAFKGIVRGRARIVLNVNSQHGFKDGEILVASMTRPEYVPLMRKASAIVTDEGGITCHAAIVSREMKIPCVIGTKIATQILKDGDLVEVDANKGEVKIIKEVEEK